MMSEFCSVRNCNEQAVEVLVVSEGWTRISELDPDMFYVCAKHRAGDSSWMPPELLDNSRLISQLLDDIQGVTDAGDAAALARRYIDGIEGRWVDP